MCSFWLPSICELVGVYVNEGEVVSGKDGDMVDPVYVIRVEWV